MNLIRCNLMLCCTKYLSLFFLGNSTSLVVGKITYSDTGAYMCVASNPAGTTRDISSLVVQDQPSRSEFVLSTSLR